MIDYKAKLEQFNSTEKYQREMEFITLLLGCKPTDVVFDIGAGIGSLVNHLRIHTDAKIMGYDKNGYGETHSWYRESIYFNVDKLIFNHSIAHIEHIELILDEVYNYINPDGSIYVVTPNKAYLNNVYTKDYVPDPTVVRHFNLQELKQLFIERGYKVQISGQFGEYEPIGGQNERLFLIAKK